MKNNLNTQDTADKYIGGTLVAAIPLDVYNRPESSIYKHINKGGLIGTIYAWVKNGSDVWWHLENGKFVKHVSVAFDFPILEASIKAHETQEQAEIDARVKERLGQNENPFYNFGKGLMNFDFDIIIWILILLIILMLVK